MNGRTVLTIALAVLAAAGIVWAQATKTPVESQIVGAVLIDMGTGHIDDEGIVHVRGARQLEYMEGDLEGILYVDVNFNVSLASIQAGAWTGEMWGRIEFVGTWGDREGVFEGKFNGTWDEGWFDGHWVAKGSGGFEGLMLKVDNYGPGSGDPQTVEGIVLAPHGD
jgi:hypothetical protein